MVGTGWMDGWMAKRRKETKGTWALALGAHSPFVPRGPEAEQLVVRTEPKDGLMGDRAERTFWPNECGRRRSWWWS